MSRKKRQATPVKGRATKATFSFRRSVLPPLAGIFVMVAVVLALNWQMLEAQFRYRYTKPQATVTSVKPAAETKVDDTKSPQPERGPLLTIPAIGSEAPIVFEPSFEEWKVQVALRSGVVHYGTTAMPGENGKVVILGHSSGQAWAPGNYKFVFTMLDKLQKGDVIYVDYNGTRYTYKVTGSIVVNPSDVSQIQPTSKPTLTLVTCTPVGTSTNRLIVHAEQISPAPADTTSNAATTPAAPARIPASAVPAELPNSANASLWQRFLDLFR